MKNSIYLALGALSISLAITACKKDKIEVTSPENVAPAATMTFPSATYVVFVDADSSLVLTADASDSDGTISKVEFYVDDVKVGEDNSSPYSLSHLFTANVDHYVKAKATDDKGASTTSAAIKTTLVIL